MYTIIGFVYLMARLLSTNVKNVLPKLQNLSASGGLRFRPWAPLGDFHPRHPNSPPAPNRSDVAVGCSKYVILQCKLDGISKNRTSPSKPFYATLEWLSLVLSRV